MTTTRAGRCTAAEWQALTADTTPLELHQALRVSFRTLQLWRKRGAPWWAARLVAVDVFGRLPLRADAQLAECFIDRDGMLFVPGLRRGVHAGDLMSLSLLPQLFSALRAESEKQKRQAKRLAFLERDIRLVRQLGLSGITVPDSDGAAITSAS